MTLFSVPKGVTVTDFLCTNQYFFFQIAGASPPAAAVQLPTGDAAHSPAAFHPRAPLDRQPANLLRGSQPEPLLPVLIGG